MNSYTKWFRKYSEAVKETLNLSNGVSFVVLITRGSLLRIQPPLSRETKAPDCVGRLFVLLYVLSYNLFTMRNKRPRIKRESNTVAVMIALYCSQNHTLNELCPECTSLLDYSRKRLDECPFQEGKTTCAKCSVHCFKPEKRERIRVVMRYSGPRMMYRHPIMAIFHLINGRRKEPLSGGDTH